MNILLSILSVIFWLILLTHGKNILVDGAENKKKKYRISEAIIGLTIVAVGTSMPELLVSMIASIGWNTEIAIGNVLGSNIANILLILWITAIISPIVLTRVTRFFDLPVVIMTSLLVFVLISDTYLDNALSNTIWRIDGIVLLGTAALYILYSLKHNNFVPDKSKEVAEIISMRKAFLWVIGWIIVLFIGGKILVDGAVDIAKIFGLSEAIIGLTIVALGTSAPELATSIVAARRGSPDLAVWNVVGSNIMNILVILGISSVISPLPFLDSSYIDLWVVIFTPILLLILSYIWTRNTVGRKEWIVLISSYVAYIIYLVVREIW